MDIPLISHIGIAVKDFEKALVKYSLLIGEEKPNIHTVVEQKVKAAIFKGGCCGGGAGVELVTPTTDDSPIAKYLDTKGEGLHHICIYVEDIALKLAELKEAGIRLIDETPRIGAEGNKIAFVHPKDMNGVLIELEEFPKESL